MRRSPSFCAIGLRKLKQAVSFLNKLQLGDVYEIMKIIPFLLFLFALSCTRAQPALTIYNKDFGVVRDTVSLQLEPGINAISYSGVTTQLEPESVILSDPSRQVDLRVLEQSYRGHPIDQPRLLQMFEGQTINFLCQLAGQEVVVAGQIIRAPSLMKVKDRFGREKIKSIEPIIKVGGHLQLQLPGLPQFPELADDSVLQPTLNWKLYADQQVTFEAQLSYLTGGLSWRADYNLLLDERGDTLNLRGWVSIENNTGKRFDAAKIKLIAGDVK